MMYSISDLTRHSISGPARRLFWAALLLSALLLSALLLLPCGPGAPAFAQGNPAQQDDRYAKVEFGAFIALHRSPQRIIPLRPDRIRFFAKVLRQPEPVSTDYLMSVLKVAGVDPLPHVSQKVFLQANDGAIQGVYLEDSAAAHLRETVAEGGRAAFFGLRAYDYSKGPAILVEKVGKVDE